MKCKIGVAIGRSETDKAFCDFSNGWGLFLEKLGVRNADANWPLFDRYEKKNILKLSESDKNHVKMILDKKSGRLLFSVNYSELRTAFVHPFLRL